MSGADRLEDGFPHGTVDGYLQGCKGGDCSMGELGLSCRRAKQLAAGDYRYQKLARRGATPVEIALELGLTPEIHAAPAKPKAAVPYEEEDVPVADLDDEIEGREDPIMDTTTTEEAVAPTPATAAKAAKARTPKPDADKPEPTANDEKRRRAEIRAWAAEHGITVGDRGRIPHAIVVGWLNEDPTLGGTRKVRRPRKKAPAERFSDAVDRAIDSESIADMAVAVSEAHEALTDAVSEEFSPEVAAALNAVADGEPDLPIPSTPGTRESIVTLPPHLQPAKSPDPDAEAVVVHFASAPDMETRARLFNAGFDEAEKQSAISIAIAEAERDTAHSSLEFALEQLGRERRRSEALAARALAAEAEMHAAHLVAISDLAIIADLDQRVTELAAENARLRQPWWKRIAS